MITANHHNHPGYVKYRGKLEATKHELLFTFSRSADWRDSDILNSNRGVMWVTWAAESQSQGLQKRRLW